jgi:GT2 family glycosyltransferase
LVSVLFPTTGRPQRADKCIRQLLKTTEGHRIEVLVEVDHDNHTMGLLTQARNGRLPVAFDPRVSVRYSHEYRGCSAAWNAALARSEGEFVVFAADDLQWGEGWLDEALNVMDESFDENGGLVGFNDGHWGRELSTHYLMSRRFVVDVLGGVVAWDCYPHSMNDLEVNERAKRAGRYAWAENARVYHDHWLFGDRPQDATDTRKLGEHSAAERAYKEREARGFPNDHDPVITE